MSVETRREGRLLHQVLRAAGRDGNALGVRVALASMTYHARAGHPNTRPPLRGWA
ncbi:hypothetical protein AB0O01_25150 [Streptomyces sp. NPDC093252]|uniref:hypothetical protein n=1 Tax=Streptomyces sp. NPDC093252 TaxID=3154980 RepID=UPI003445DB93